jgi:NAD(P)-dependent dehydrogenase (short-subunit alcohol dehydrogenase family)
VPKAIHDQVVVITGASSGIGLVTAREAARRGAKVVLAARNVADLEHAVAEIRREGGSALAVPTDVSEYQQVAALASRAVAAYGRIDTWVNNAGVSAYATFVDMPLEDFQRIMQVNFMGQVYGAKAALPHLEASGGTLVCVGSTLSDRGVPLQGAYCASKHALKGWLDALRVELRRARSPVRVTLVKPSSINTPLFNKAKTSMGVMPQPIPPVYEPELAAEAILRAAVARPREVFVGGAGKALSVAERMSPKLVDLHQRWQGFDQQKTTWPKSSDAPSNLHRPLASDGGLRGDFVARAHHWSVYQTIESHATSAAALASVALVLAGWVAIRRRTRAASRSGVAPLLLAGAFGLAGKAILSGVAEG